MTQVLEHGYVKMVESWGSDERIIEAARMSTNKGFLGWGKPERPCECCKSGGAYYIYSRTGTCATCCGSERSPAITGDEKLLRYLYENKHATPFEMAGMTIEVQAPIFVFREWHRHRTQSYNEMSARYTPLPDLNYVPTIERLLVNSNGTNKQSGTITGAPALTEKLAKRFQTRLIKSYAEAEDFYQMALETGVPKELARVHLPVGRYSRMMASANLRNWLGFLTLRVAPGAQWEIRQFAHEVSKLIEQTFPRTYGLFVESL